MVHIESSLEKITNGTIIIKAACYAESMEI
jgi:hypothetical protein